LGNFISGQREQASHTPIHATPEPDPPAALAPQPNPAGAGTGPPALANVGPRPRALDNFPDETFLAIAAHLGGPRPAPGQAQDLRGMLRDVSNLAATSRALHRTITQPRGGIDALQTLRLRRTLEPAVIQCLNELSVIGALDFAACGRVLVLLKPEERAMFVQLAIGKPDPMAKAEAIAGLTAGMVFLQPADRQALVDAALSLGTAGEGNLGLHDFHTNLEGRLAKATALGGLLEANGCLQAEQLDAIFGGTLSLIEEQEGMFCQAAVIGLGKSICHLPEQQRAALVQWALDVPNEGDRAVQLGRLGLAMAAEPSMNAEGRIVGAALAVVDDQRRADVIADLAVGMGSMDEAQKALFLDAAGGFTDETLKSRVARGLGAAAEHLSDAKRAELVRFATVPGAIVLGGQNAGQNPEAFMVYRLLGLVAGVAHLSAEQRNAVFSAVLELEDPSLRAEAIGSLGQGLARLSIEQREQLVAAVIELDDNNDNYNAYNDAYPERMFAAISGLDAGLKHLDGRQRNRLVDAVSEFTGEPIAGPKLGALAALTSALTPPLTSAVAAVGVDP
jgi:hypothetical protein